MTMPDRVSIRLSEYDKQVLTKVAEGNPHLTDIADLARHAWRHWHIDQTDENSKSKRLERVEHRTEEILERLISLENKIERMNASGVVHTHG